MTYPQLPILARLTVRAVSGMGWKPRLVSKRRRQRVLEQLGLHPQDGPSHVAELGSV